MRQPAGLVDKRSSIRSPRLQRQSQAGKIAIRGAAVTTVLSRGSTANREAWQIGKIRARRKSCGEFRQETGGMFFCHFPNPASVQILPARSFAPVFLVWLIEFLGEFTHRFGSV